MEGQDRQCSQLVGRGEWRGVLSFQWRVDSICCLFSGMCRDSQGTVTNVLMLDEILPLQLITAKLRGSI